MRLKAKYSRKAWMTGWMVLALSGSLSARAAVVVLDTGFEATDTPSYTEGEQLHHAGGEPYNWNWSGDNIGTISTDPAAVYEGSQGLDATRTDFSGSQLWWTRPDNAFNNLDSGTVQIDLAVKTTGWADSQDSFLEIAASDIPVDDFGGNGTRSAWLTLKGNQRLYALDGGSEQELASGIDITDWNLIRMDINLGSATYDVYLNDTLLASGFSFYGSGVGSVSSLQFKEYNSGAASGGVYLDNLKISWSPVPEPGSMSLFVMWGLLLMKRLRRRKSFSYGVSAL